MIRISTVDGGFMDVNGATLDSFARDVARTIGPNPIIRYEEGMIVLRNVTTIMEFEDVSE